MKTDSGHGDDETSSKSTDSWQIEDRDEKKCQPFIIET
jgi:hypothetical protein